jgi:hypothetical protein
MTGRGEFGAMQIQRELSLDFGEPRHYHPIKAIIALYRKNIKQFIAI